jgi:hypothetical protein
VPRRKPCRKMCIDKKHTCIRPHTSAHVSTRQHTSACVSIRQTCMDTKHTTYANGIEHTCRLRRVHTSAYVSIRQHTSAHVRTREHTSDAHTTYANGTEHICRLSGLSMRAGGSGTTRRTPCQHPSASVSIRQHTSAYVSIRNKQAYAWELLAPPLRSEGG